MIFVNIGGGIDMDFDDDTAEDLADDENEDDENKDDENKDDKDSAASRGSLHTCVAAAALSVFVGGVALL